MQFSAGAKEIDYNQPFSWSKFWRLNISWSFMKPKKYYTLLIFHDYYPLLIVGNSSSKNAIDGKWILNNFVSHPFNFLNFKNNDKIKVYLLGHNREIDYDDVFFNIDFGELIEDTTYTDNNGDKFELLDYDEFRVDNINSTLELITNKNIIIKDNSIDTKQEKYCSCLVKVGNKNNKRNTKYNPRAVCAHSTGASTHDKKGCLKLYDLHKARMSELRTISREYGIYYKQNYSRDKLVEGIHKKLLSYNYE